MLELLIFILGGVLGCYFTRMFMKPKYAGVLKSVVMEDEEQPSLLLDLHESVDAISNSEYVTFKVKKLKV